MERAREEIWSYLDNLFTDRQTDGRTLLVPKVAIATENLIGQKPVGTLNITVKI